MNLLTSLKIDTVLDKFDNFLDLIQKSSTPLLINETYHFSDSICEHETMDDRTDIFAHYSSFNSFNELLYPSSANLINLDKQIKNFESLSDTNLQNSKDPKKKEISENVSMLEHFKHINQENDNCSELIMLSVSEMDNDQMTPLYKKKDLIKEFNKLNFELKALDIVYFFDLMISKNARFFYKEQLLTMFYDNIFIHNKGKVIH